MYQVILCQKVHLALAAHHTVAAAFPDSGTPASSQILGVLCVQLYILVFPQPDSLLLTAWSCVWQCDLPGMQSAIGQTVLAVLFGELEELFCNGCHSICNRVKLLYILASCHASSRPLPSIVLPKHCKAQCGMHQGITPTCFVLWI